MKFSVIVPVYNTSRYLDRCISALQALDYPRDDYEILMVDNNSTDNSADILARASGIRTLRETKQGSYAARNCALREAKGSLLAFTDSDCLPDPSWLKEIEASLQDPATQIVLGYRRPACNSGLVKLLADYENKKDQLVFRSSSPDVYYGFTNNMGVRRSAFDLYGPFVERPRGADTIFVRRVVNGEGCDSVVYSDKMCVEHEEMESVFSYYKKMYTYGCSRQLYRHIMKTRALTTGERLRVLCACLQEEKYPWYTAVLFVITMIGGIIAWSLGSNVSRWQAPR